MRRASCARKDNVAATPKTTLAVEATLAVEGTALNLEPLNLETLILVIVILSEVRRSQPESKDLLFLCTSNALEREFSRRSSFSA